MFPHRLGPPYKKALKTLAALHLGKIIQDSAGEGACMGGAQGLGGAVKVGWDVGK